jgi:hypothetical protein
VAALAGGWPSRVEKLPEFCTPAAGGRTLTPDEILPWLGVGYHSGALTGLARSGDPVEAFECTTASSFVQATVNKTVKSNNTLMINTLYVDAAHSFIMSL